MSSTPSDLIRVHCPCGARMKVRPSSLGRKAKCPKCQEVFVIAQDKPAQDLPIDIAPAEIAPSPDSLLAELAKQEKQQVAVSQSASSSSSECPQCGTQMPGNAVMCVSCGFNTQSGRSVRGTTAKKSARADKVRKLVAGAGTYILGCVFSGVGALIGAGIWFAIAVLANFEIGWIAWGLGVLAGAGMYLGYKGQNLRAGLTAVGFSLFGILAAKLMIFVFMVNAIIYGNTNDIDMQRNFIKIIRTEERLNDQKIWADEERDKVWDSTYDIIDREVDSMTDEVVLNTFEELKAEQKRYSDGIDETGMKRNRIAYHQATRRANHLGLGYGDPKRDQIFEEESKKIKRLDDARLDQQITSIEEWEKGDKWSDQDYVHDELIYQLVEQEFENDPKYKDKEIDIYELSKSRWNRFYKPAAERVDALDFQTQTQQLKDMVQKQEDDGNRFRLAYHHHTMRVRSEGLSYNNPKREEILKELEEKYALLNREEMDSEIRDLDQWEESGRESDYSYLRSQLIYKHINQMMGERRRQIDSDSDEYWEPSEQEWEELYSQAEDKVDPQPDNELAAQIKLVEQEQERQWEIQREAIETEEAVGAVGEMAGVFMEAMFSPMDALFIFLAIGSAFKIATRGASDE